MNIQGKTTVPNAHMSISIIHCIVFRIEVCIKCKKSAAVILILFLIRLFYRTCFLVTHMLALTEAQKIKLENYMMHSFLENFQVIVLIHYALQFLLQFYLFLSALFFTDVDSKKSFCLLISYMFFDFL